MSLATPVVHSRTPSSRHESSSHHADALISKVDDEQVDEAFGQTGVRQYFGRMISWLCITISLCAGAMWYRSLSFVDKAEWRGQGQTLVVRSIYGRLHLSAAGYPAGGGKGSGWSYSGGYFQRRWVEDRWAPSIWKTVGIQLSRDDDAISRGATSSALIRVKWYLVAIVFGAFPIVRWLLLMRARRREEVE